MKENVPNMKFYSLEKSKLEGINKDVSVSEIKEVKASTEFNKALASVIKKDINKIEIRLKSIIANITKLLAKNSVFFDEQLEADVNNFENIINIIESKISEMIIKKGNIKVGIFSSRKKEKRKNIENLEEDIKNISKLQNDIISLKDEYIKLRNRLNNIGVSDVLKEELDDTEDPLERTINFYMNKNKK